MWKNCRDGPRGTPMKDKICKWCGATVCDPSNAFHAFLRKHDLHPWCWSGVDAGWLPLLDRLATDLKALGWKGKVAQIKEKFGGLRFYAEDTEPPMEARIRLAELESARTCEVCGRPADLGPIAGGSWIQTLCAIHRRLPREGVQVPNFWFGAVARGVHPLGPAVRLVLTELGVDLAIRQEAAQPPVLLGLLAPAMPCVFIKTAVAMIETVAWNLVAEWLNVPQQGHAYVAAKSRSRGAESLLAIRSDVPLKVVQQRKLTDDQRAMLAATSGGLDAAPVIVDDAGGVLESVTNRVEGLAATTQLGLIVLTGLKFDPKHKDLLEFGLDEQSLNAAVLEETLAHLVVLAEEQRCQLVLVSAGERMAHVAATDESLRTAWQVLKIEEEYGVWRIGDLRLEVLPSGRFSPV
jgi:hypothetical protein